MSDNWDVGLTIIKGRVPPPRSNQWGTPAGAQSGGGAPSKYFLASEGSRPPKLEFYPPRKGGIFHRVEFFAILWGGAL